MFLVSPDPVLSESREVRKKDDDCEDGDHAQNPSQKSSTGSSLLVRPQSSPLMPNSTERSGDTIVLSASLVSRLELTANREGNHKSW